jgi:hypothetical protein
MKPFVPDLEVKVLTAVIGSSWRKLRKSMRFYKSFSRAEESFE